MSYLVQDGRTRTPYDVVRIENVVNEDESYEQKHFPLKCCEGNVYLRKKKDVETADIERNINT